MNEEEIEAGDTLIGLLSQLAEPAEPAPVSMVPQTVGWVVVAVMIAILVAVAIYRAWHRWQAAAYRRAALQELEVAGDEPVAVAGILRRTALAAWPRSRVASLTGRDWLDFLDATGKGGFSNGPGRAILGAPYEGASEPVPGLGEAAALWVRSHRLDRTT